MHTPRPLLSIIIPCTRTSGLLHQCIKSAIRSAPANELEILLVWNGSSVIPECLSNLYQYPQLKLLHSPLKNSNAARNEGLKNASGKYVRFIDDDDFFLAPGALNQLLTLESSGAEICSGRLAHSNNLGHILSKLSFPSTNDFFSAAVSFSGMALPTSTIYLKKAIKNFSWDETIPFHQDYCWMMQLASKKEWNWVKTNELVGVWRHHDEGERISKHNTIRRFPKWLFEHFEKASQYNRRTGLSEHRCKSIIMGAKMAGSIHFASNPLLATLYSHKTLSMNNQTLPLITAYLIKQWLKLPIRYGAAILPHSKRVERTL